MPTGSKPNSGYTRTWSSPGEIEYAKLADGSRDIVVHGSPQLAQTLIEHDLVDALLLLVYPIIVGAGKRLFAQTSETKPFRLARTETFGDGVQLLVYERSAS